MRVKLKVMKGASAGKIFEVKVPQFVIGRSSGCQLRPQSDAISRQHCVILVSDEGATIRDLGSRNGTIVNGTAIAGETRLATDDQLRVGPLHLLVTVTDDAGVAVKPTDPAAEVKVKRVDPQPEQAAPKAAGPVKPSDSGIISDWLLADDDAERESTGLSQVATRQFKLDETERIELEKAAVEAEQAEPEGKKSGKKKEPGKLPPRAEDQTANSQEAAEQTLRKMFQRGL